MELLLLGEKKWGKRRAGVSSNDDNKKTIWMQRPRGDNGQTDYYDVPARNEIHDINQFLPGGADLFC